MTLVAGISPWRTRPGGIRSYVLGLAKYLTRAGHDVTFVGAGGLEGRESFRYVPAVPDPETSSLRFLRGLRRVAVQMDDPADVIHTQRPDDIVPLHRGSGAAPFIVTIHGDPLPGVRMRHGRIGSIAYRRYERRGVAIARRLLFVDPAGREAFAARYPAATRKFRETQLGLDMEVFRPVDSGEAKAEWQLPDRPHVLYAGRLIAEKNLGLLASALSLCESRPTLLVAGSGPDEASLREALRGVSVRFLGVVPHEEMPGLYSAVDSTVLTSTREALPMAVLESLACGTPVVATRVGRLEEMIDPFRNGALASLDAVGFARALDGVLALGRTLRDSSRSSVERFAWPTVLPALVSSYREVAS